MMDNQIYSNKATVDFANRLKLELLCGKARFLSNKLFVTYSNRDHYIKPLGYIRDHHQFGYSQGLNETHGVEFSLSSNSSQMRQYGNKQHTYLESGIDYYYISPKTNYVEFVGELMLDKEPLIVNQDGLATVRLVITHGAIGIYLRDFANIVGDVPITYWDGPGIHTYHYRNEKDSDMPKYDPATIKMHFNGQLEEDSVPSMYEILDFILDAYKTQIKHQEDFHASVNCSTKDKFMMINYIYTGGMKRYGITDIFYQPKKRPTTIVKFTDGTVSVVKLKKGDKEDIRVAIMYAIMKHDNSKFNHDMKDLEDMVVVQDVSRK